MMSSKRVSRDSVQRNFQQIGAERRGRGTYHDRYASYHEDKIFRYVINFIVYHLARLYKANAAESR